MLNPESAFNLIQYSQDSIGIYVHVPFCDGKCPYCDFYSVRADEARMDEYTDCIIDHIKSDFGENAPPADTLYFGGGTPNLLGAKRICRIVEAARARFGLDSAEITVEANPGRDLSGFFREVHAAGVNRISLGLQSPNDEELTLLGRRHTTAQAEQAIGAVWNAGIDNLSLDLMLAIQGQTEESLSRSVAFCTQSGAEHVSAYLLTIEPHTLYEKERAELRLPDEDMAAALYLQACDELKRCGYFQYEISNFAKPGRESRHNLKYWHCESYWGLGPAAHSFLYGRRFHYERSIGAFLREEPPVQDGEGGSFEEFAMLALRLTEGLTDKSCLARFGYPIPDRIKRAARRYERNGLTICEESSFHFTAKGFLVSDALTAEILFTE